MASKSEEVVDLVTGMSLQAQAQAVAIYQITQSLEQVSSVVQMNSATSEESAATSEELSSQADSLGVLISRFKIEGI